MEAEFAAIALRKLIGSIVTVGSILAALSASGDEFLEAEAVKLAREKILGGVMSIEPQSGESGLVAFRFLGGDSDVTYRISAVRVSRRVSATRVDARGSIDAQVRPYVEGVATGINLEAISTEASRRFRAAVSHTDSKRCRMLERLPRELANGGLKVPVPVLSAPKLILMHTEYLELRVFGSESSGEWFAAGDGSELRRWASTVASQIDRCLQTDSEKLH
jgi:hypothetical protein